METEYSKRELDSKFVDVHHRFDDIAIRLTEVLAQTTTTNGKVADIQKWRERLTGASAVVFVVLLPILGWGLHKISVIDDIVADGIKEQLSNYQIEIK